MGKLADGLGLGFVDRRHAEGRGVHSLAFGGLGYAVLAGEAVWRPGKTKWPSAIGDHSQRAVVNNEAGRESRGPALARWTGSGEAGGQRMRMRMAEQAETCRVSRMDKCELSSPSMLVSGTAPPTPHDSERRILSPPLSPPLILHAR